MSIYILFEYPRGIREGGLEGRLAWRSGRLCTWLASEDMGWITESMEAWQKTSTNYILLYMTTIEIITLSCSKRSIKVVTSILGGVSFAEPLELEPWKAARTCLPGPPSFSAKVTRRLLNTKLGSTQLLGNDTFSSNMAAFPSNPNGMMAGMNPTAGMSEQEVQMTKMVPSHLLSARQPKRRAHTPAHVRMLTAHARFKHRWNPAPARQ